MGNLVNLTEHRETKKQAVNQEQLDVAASYACLEKCLKYIELNSLSELRDLKAMMRKTMKILSDMKK